MYAIRSYYDDAAVARVETREQRGVPRTRLGAGVVVPALRVPPPRTQHPPQPPREKGLGAVENPGRGHVENEHHHE